jgi:hypothetical protein
MFFNFPLFSRLVERAYEQAVIKEYPLDDVLAVFRHYFQRYEDTFKSAHPHIRVSQIERIINAMPYIESDGKSSAGGCITPDDYSALIDRHFKTRYRNCDYNINHFFSGGVRLMRYYDEFC